MKHSTTHKTTKLKAILSLIEPMQYKMQESYKSPQLHASMYGASNLIEFKQQINTLLAS